MIKLGSGDSGEMTMLDILAILSFVIALENLDMNLTQTDKAELQEDLQEKFRLILVETHRHLEEQDHKIDEILKILEGQNATNQEIRGSDR